jgi:hypothetical protein
MIERRQGNKQQATSAAKQPALVTRQVARVWAAGRAFHHVTSTKGDGHVKWSPATFVNSQHRAYHYLSRRRPTIAVHLATVD